jgi:hypothetical protein
MTWYKILVHVDERHLGPSKYIFYYVDDNFADSQQFITIIDWYIYALYTHMWIVLQSLNIKTLN